MPEPRDEWDELRDTFKYTFVDSLDRKHNRRKRVLKKYFCPFCNEDFYTDDIVVCGTLPDDYSHKHMFFAHDDCVSVDWELVLNNLGYSLVRDTGAEMDKE